jgi:tetratricopeptide (TPR) repeat protein
MLLAIFVGVTSIRAQEVQDDPEAEAILLFNKGQDAHQAGDLKGAIEFYEKALKLIPEFPEAELQRGSAFQALGNLDSAEASFRRAVALREDWSLALANLGTLLVKRGKYDEAKPFLKRGVELDKENTPAYLALSTLAIRTNAPAQELEEFHKKITAMTAASKGIASVWAAKASLENALGDKKAAAASAARALELDAKNTGMLALLAAIALDAGDPELGDAQIKKIEALEPAAPELSILKTQSLLAKGKDQDALKFIDAVSSPSKELMDLKARIEASNSTDAAALEKKLEADPRDLAVLSRLCSINRVKDPARAMDFCRRAAEAEPGNIEHAIGFGAAMLQAKQFAQAEGLFQKLIASAPDNFTLRANLATALFQLKRYNEAKVHFHWLVEKQPENAAAYFFLAVSHDQLQEFGDAAANYQIFLKKADPKVNQLEIDKVNLRLPILQRQLDAGKGRKNAKTKS